MPVLSAVPSAACCSAEQMNDCNAVVCTSDDDDERTLGEEFLGVESISTVLSLFC